MPEKPVQVIGMESKCAGCAHGTMIRTRATLTPWSASHHASEHPEQPVPEPFDMLTGYCANPRITGPTWGTLRMDTVIDCEAFKSRSVP